MYEPAIICNGLAAVLAIPQAIKFTVPADATLKKASNLTGTAAPAGPIPVIERVIDCPDTGNCPAPPAMVADCAAEPAINFA